MGSLKVCGVSSFLCLFNNPAGSYDLIMSISSDFVCHPLFHVTSVSLITEVESWPISTFLEYLEFDSSGDGRLE